MFNAQQWLNDVGIPYWTSGKNVSHGWTTISCPFCGDRSNHGGIAPGGHVYTCLKCGPKGSVLNLVKQVLQIPYEQAKDILNQYSNILRLPEYYQKERALKVEWPPPCYEKQMPSVFAQYLYSRNFIPSQIEELYNVKAVYLTGDFKYRLVIPIFENGKIVTYIGRDITGKSTLRYKNLKEELSILPAKECVYNLDAVGDHAIITEGVTDVWRLRYNAVGMQGLMFTRRQVRLLSRKLKKATLCYDSEPGAQIMAMALAEELSLTGVETEILFIDKSDPGELTETEAEEVRKEVFG